MKHKKADFIKRIKKEAGNMNNLINDILMISRLETKEAEVLKSDVRLSILMEDIIESLEPLAASTKFFFIWTVSRSASMPTASR